MSSLDYRDAVEHLNRVVALMDLTLPPRLSTTAQAALFLLRSHRKHGTQIRQSVYDYALSIDKPEDRT
jgi:hypothetical protein